MHVHVHQGGRATSIAWWRPQAMPAPSRRPPPPARRLIERFHPLPRRAVAAGPFRPHFRPSPRLLSSMATHMSPRVTGAGRRPRTSTACPGASRTSRRWLDVTTTRYVSAAAAARVTAAVPVRRVVPPRLHRPQGHAPEQDLVRASQTRLARPTRRRYCTQCRPAFAKRAK